MTQLKQHATAADIEAFERLLRDSLSDDVAPRARAGERAPAAQPAAPSASSAQPFPAQPFPAQPFSGQTFPGQPFTAPSHAARAPSSPPQHAQRSSAPPPSAEPGIEDPLVLFAAELRGLSAPGEARATADDWARLSGADGANDPLADADADAVRAAAQYEAASGSFGGGAAFARSQAGFATATQSDDDILREMLAPAGAARETPGAVHRPRRIFYGLAGAAAVAVVAITFGFGWRKPVTDSAGAGGVPVIVADSGPTKERPADPGGVEQPNQDARVLSRPRAGAVEPSAVSSREEQPVDLAATLRQNEQQGGVPISEPRKVTSVPIRLEPQADGAGNGATRPVRDVAVQPQPAPPVPVTTETLALAPTRAAALPRAEPAPPAPETATPGARPEPAPAPVVRSVVPLTPGANAPTAPTRPEGARVDPPKPLAPKIETPRLDAARLDTPKIDTPKIDPLKTEARPVTTPLAAARPVETPARPDAARTTPTSRPSPPKVAAVAPPKEQKKLPPAAAETSEETALPSGAPLSLQPQPRARPGAQTAARSEAPAESGGSGFAVQLSASPSREEAQKSASALGSRFAGALSGAAPRVVTGEAKGQSVYRVRVTGLSREGAVGLCERIKSAGGNCFIARN